MDWSWKDQGWGHRKGEIWLELVFVIMITVIIDIIIVIIDTIVTLINIIRSIRKFNALMLR